MDVRTFDVTTPEGNILKYGTPEYQLESKFSRLGGRGGPQGQSVGLRYTQEGGLEAPLDIHKGAKDFADLYAGAAYLSRESAIKGMPGISRAYESVATNLKTYAETTGTAEKFAEIKGNPLGEARAARQIRANLGGILGVEIGIPEYPRALTAGKTAEGKAVPVAALEYPEATSTSTQLTSAAYPEATATSTYPEAMISSSYGVSTPTVSTSTGAYPAGGISSETYYGVAGFAPENYNRFMSYPTTLPQPEYPRGIGYPSETPYPRGRSQPYPTTYPTGKVSTVGFGPVPSIKITLPEILAPKSEDRLVAPPIRTRNYFKFHEILQGIDYSRVNLITGYGGKLSTITSKKTGYFDVKYSVKESPLGTVTSGKESIDLIQQSIQITPTRNTYKQFAESRARGPVDIGPDFGKARFNIPKKQTYYRRKK